MDVLKLKRESKIAEAKNSILEFIENTDIDTSKIDREIRKRLNKVIDRVHDEYKISGN